MKAKQMELTAFGKQVKKRLTWSLDGSKIIDAYQKTEVM